MSDLQIALLAAGALAVLGVWGYNVWQESQYRKKANALFRGGQIDALMPPAPGGEAESRQDPTLSPDGVDSFARVEPRLASNADAHVDLAQGDAFSDGGDAHAPAAPAVPLEESLPYKGGSSDVPDSGLIDELTDCAIRFRLVEPVPAAGVWAAQARWSASIGKPLRWLARARGGGWAPISAATNQGFDEWVASLQLVDRRGAVTEAELMRFFNGMQELARQLEGETDLPERADTLVRAQQLDELCAHVDVQFGLSVLHAQGGAFIGTKLRGVCEAAGLELDGDGRYHARNAAGDTEFTLANIGGEGFDPQGMSSLATSGVSLGIDVPCVRDGAAVFNRMVMVARQLAQGLGGVLVDPQRAPLSENMVGIIRSKIAELQETMAAANIPAGGARARRLFS